MAELDLENSLPIAFALDLSERQDQLERLVFDLVRSETGAKRPTREAIALLLGNLLRCSRILDAGFLAYPRNHNTYAGPTRYRESEIGHEAFLRAVDILTRRRLVQNHPGFYRPDGEGRMSRLGMEPELVGLLGEADLLGWYPVRKPLKEPIILRAKGGLPLDYSDCDATRRKRNELMDFTSMLGGHELALDGLSWPVQEASLARIFNRGDPSFECGGRHYKGWWQYACEKEERSEIRIDGEPTVELDYSGQHIYMLYGLHAHRQYRGDPYEVQGGPPTPRLRELSKLAFLIAINARSKQSALAAITNEATKKLGFTPKREELEWLLGALIDKHEPIRDRVMKDDGIRLQGIDSDIMAKVLNRATRSDTPVLPVHDSVICRERDQEAVEAWMKESYAERIGFEAEVKCKRRPHEAREWRQRLHAKHDAAPSEARQRNRRRSTRVPEGPVTRDLSPSSTNPTLPPP